MRDKVVFLEELNLLLRPILSRVVLGVEQRQRVFWHLKESLGLFHELGSGVGLTVAHVGRRELVGWLLDGNLGLGLVETLVDCALGQGQLTLFGRFIDCAGLVDVGLA